MLTSGDNSYGQLGYRRDELTMPPSDHPPPPNSNRLPQVVPALRDMEVAKISCGDFFCIASCKGEVWVKGELISENVQFDRVDSALVQRGKSPPSI